MGLKGELGAYDVVPAIVVEEDPEVFTAVEDNEADELCILGSGKPKMVFVWESGNGTSGPREQTKAFE